MSLREAAEAALHCLETSRVFVTSRERIKRPEGEDFYDEAIEALRAALAEAEPVDEEVIGEYGWQGTSRQWWSGGAWLEPDDVVIVRRAAARGKG